MSSDKGPSMEVDPHVEKRYEILGLLGKGAYGIVWRAVDRKTKQGVALKKVFDAFQNQSDAQRTYREVMFLYRLDHGNIIKLHNVMRADNRMDLYLAFEIMETDLYATIRCNILQDVHKQFVTYQILRSIRYLHAVQIIHRDLKPANVLLNSDCHAKLADFGLARSLVTLKQEQEHRPVLTDYIATRWYRPPEIVLTSTEYTKAIDMWAVGCIIGEMLTGSPLLPGTSTLNQMEKIISAVGHPTPSDIQSMRSQFVNELLDSLDEIKMNPLRSQLASHNRDAVDLICKLLVFNPKNRLTAVEAMRHPYVAQFCTPAELRDDPPMDPITLNFSDYERLSVDNYRDALHKDIVKRKKELKKQKLERKAAKEQRKLKKETVCVNADKSTAQSAAAAPSNGGRQGAGSSKRNVNPDDNYDDDAFED